MRFERTEFGEEGCTLTGFSTEGQGVKPCFWFLLVVDTRIHLNSPESSLRFKKGGYLSVFEELHYTYPGPSWHEVLSTEHTVKGRPPPSHLGEWMPGLSLMGSALPPWRGQGSGNGIWAQGGRPTCGFQFSSLRLPVSSGNSWDTRINRDKCLNLWKHQLIQLTWIVV